MRSKYLDINSAEKSRCRKVPMPKSPPAKKIQCRKVCVLKCARVGMSWKVPDAKIALCRNVLEPKSPRAEKAPCRNVPMLKCLSAQTSAAPNGACFGNGDISAQDFRHLEFSWLGFLNIQKLFTPFFGLVDIDKDLRLVLENGVKKYLDIPSAEKSRCRKLLVPKSTGAEEIQCRKVPVPKSPRVEMCTCRNVMEGPRCRNSSVPKCSGVEISICRNVCSTERCMCRNVPVMKHSCRNVPCRKGLQALCR